MTSDPSDGAGSDGAGTWYLLRARRYLIAGVGPVALAGTNFAISFAMLRLEEPASFGVFTFLFVAAQFTVGLSAALFGAPLQALSVTHDAGREEGGAKAIVGATAVSAVLAGGFFLLLARLFGLTAIQALCYAIYPAMMILRWVGRAWSYAVDQPSRAAASDLVYAVVTLGALGLSVGVIGVKPDTACYAALAIGAAASLPPFGRRYAAMLLRRPRRAAWHLYRDIWRHQSRWALLGVAATEAAANAHIYLVTLVAGGDRMAPIAAAALLMRPINVVQNALTEYERPQMARLIAAGAREELGRTSRLFLAVLLAAWLGTVMIAYAVVHFCPGLAFSHHYDLDVVRLAVTLWTLVTFFILFQMPDNVMLQATGNFRALAGATLWSSLVNVAGVAVVLTIAEPVWTVAAMAAGWLLDFVLVRRAALRMRRMRGLA